MDVLKVLGALGIGSIIVAAITGVVNWYTSKRKFNTEDKDVAIQAIEAAIPGLGDIISQMRSQIKWLSEENEKCLRVSAAQAIEITSLKYRLAEVERTSSGTV